METVAEGMKAIYTYTYTYTYIHTHTHTHIYIYIYIYIHIYIYIYIYIRGAHILFRNLDELMTSLLCFLHYIIDQFRNRSTCDKEFLLIPRIHFHSMRQNVR